MNEFANFRLGQELLRLIGTLRIGIGGARPTEIPNAFLRRDRRHRAIFGQRRQTKWHAALPAEQ